MYTSLFGYGILKMGDYADKMLSKYYKQTVRLRQADSLDLAFIK